VREVTEVEEVREVGKEVAILFYNSNLKTHNSKLSVQTDGIDNL
jgi:hypothetical protein